MEKYSLFEIGSAIFFFAIYILVVIWLIRRILSNKYITSDKKTIYIVLTCINIFLGLLFYHLESNKRLRKRYSAKN